MSDIPAARDMLSDLSGMLEAGETTPVAASRFINKTIMPLLWRKPPVRRGPVKNAPITPTLAKNIKRFAAQNPQAHLQEIADYFGVNIGRVSEVLNG